jgi:hypothetical protein
MSDFEDDDVTADDADRVRRTEDGDADHESVDDEELIEDIAGDVRTDILLGHVEDDVTNVLEERLEEVGLHVPPEEIDELADEIENDVSS